MTRIDTQTAEDLLAQSKWLRNLSRTLVRDDARAEDLCQEAMFQSLRRPSSSTNSKPWLARAVRSLGARFGRDEQRRRRRETVAAKPEALPSTADVVEQVANQRIVVDAVMSLDEPYRSTVLLRFWEDLPPRMVAQRMQVPVETVRTRLKRGLSMLRRRLDSEFGGRGAWIAPVAACIPKGRATLLLASGGAVVKTKTIALAVVAVCGLVLLWSPWDDATDPAAERLAEGSAVEPQRAAGAQDTAPAQRQVVESPVLESSLPPTVVEAGAVFRGRVLDAVAEPMAQVGVRVRTESSVDDGGQARSDGAGFFSFPRPSRSGEVLVDELGLVTVLAGVVQPGDVESQPVVVTTPALRFAGVVLSEDGTPLSGALVSCTLPEDFRARFGAVLDFSRAERWAVRAGVDGGFDLPAAGLVGGAQLRFSMDGYLPISMDQPAASDETMRIVLDKPAPVEGSLQGLVVDPVGVPVGDARVSLGTATTVSDPSGRFIIDMQAAGKNHELIAMKRGYLPGTHRLLEWEEEFRAADQAFATVRLGEPPLQIFGQLVDDQGAPVAGAQIWAADPTVFGDLQEGLGLISVEGYLSGGMTVGEMMTRFAPDGVPTMPVEQILKETPTAKWSWVKTDADGRFDLGGLLDRPYRLSALLPNTLVRVDGGPFPAGMAGVRMVVPAAAVLPVVAGRVTSRAGAPVAGVRVRTVCDTLDLERVTYTVDGRRRTRGSGRSETGRSTVTDAQGRFRFEDVGAQRVYLTLESEEIMPRSFGKAGLLTADTPVADLVISVSLRFHVQIELADPETADQVGAMGADGESINLLIMSGDGVDSMDRFRLFEGRSEVLSAPESVTTLVLFKDGEEVRRIPVNLVPGDVNVIRE